MYPWDANNNPVVRTPDAPYTIRLLVRRSANLHKFSGTVWVEPFNPTLAIDLDRMWPNHGAYVSKVALYTTQLVKERFLLPLDAPKIITEAAQANVP